MHSKTVMAARAQDVKIKMRTPLRIRIFTSCTRAAITAVYKGIPETRIQRILGAKARKMRSHQR